MQEQLNPNSSPQKSRLPKTVILLGWVSALTDVSSEMVYPVIPLFLVGVLGAPVLALGAIEGFAEALVSLMKGYSGWHSDQRRRRTPYIRWGYGLAATAKPILALAFAWPVVFLARSLDRFGKGVRTSARDALIADVVERNQAGRAFGYHRAMDTSGALVGVLILFMLMQLFPASYRMIFILAFIPGFCSLILTFFVKEASHVQLPVTETLSESPKPAFSFHDFPKAYWISLGLLCIFALGNSSDTFLLLRGKDIGLSDSMVILAYACYNLTYAALSYPAGLLSDKWGRWRVILMGWLLYALTYIGFAFIETGWIWGLFALYGCYMGLTMGVGKALIADYAPKEQKGTALGFFHASIGLSTLLSSLMAGFLWDQWGPKATFLCGAGFALVSAVVLVGYLGIKREKKLG